MKNRGIHQQHRNNVRLLSLCQGRVILQKAPAMIHMITPMSEEMSQQSQNVPISLSQDVKLYMSTHICYYTFCTIKEISVYYMYTKHIQNAAATV